tara:strand:- start:648 stop:929 length:282 start_codon:yes stop_codon:yes gene_type:complete
MTDKKPEQNNEDQVTPQQQFQLLVTQTLQQTVGTLMQDTFNTMHTLCDKVASKAILEAMTDKQLSQIITACDKELEKRSKAQEELRSKRSTNA